MSNTKTPKKKIKFKDLLTAAKRNLKTAPRKTLYWIIGAGLAILVLLIVWINDLIFIFG